MAKKTKIVDKWKLKNWYMVLAPQLFDNQELCEIAANDEKQLVNRIIRIGLNELVDSGSQSAFFTTLLFRINSAEGGKAKTTLIGHEISPSYIKTFARRGKTLIHMIIDGKTTDEQEVRLKVVAVTVGRISDSTRHSLRKGIAEKVVVDVAAHNYDELMQDILYGRFVSRLYNELKKIATMRRVEIRKTEKKEVFA